MRSTPSDARELVAIALLLIFNKVFNSKLVFVIGRIAYSFGTNHTAHLALWYLHGRNGVLAIKGLLAGCGAGLALLVEAASENSDLSSSLLARDAAMPTFL